MWLVNISLKLWSLNTAFTLILQFAKATHIFFSKYTCALDVVLTRTVNILTANELVELHVTMLCTTRHWSFGITKSIPVIFEKLYERHVWGLICLPAWSRKLAKSFVFSFASVFVTRKPFFLKYINTSLGTASPKRSFYLLYSPLVFGQMMDDNDLVLVPFNII